EFRDCFSLFAKEKFITSREQLTKIMRSLAFSPTMFEVDRYFGEHSRDNRIDFATFISILEKQLKVEKCQKDIIEAFQAHDKDGTGFVPASELRHILTQFGDKLTPQEVDKLFRDAGVQGAQVKYENVINCLLTPIQE
ncbi:hypothetical protein HELRODRAFT_71575, partial [Helobdella robusta]|uniref:EF-hand domain-containing protein n=1 Tax=Helobdella robusta TaxID=6412 RepID=T1G0N7_HELRO